MYWDLPVRAQTTVTHATVRSGTKVFNKVKMRNWVDVSIKNAQGDTSDTKYQHFPIKLVSPDERAKQNINRKGPVSGVSRVSGNIFARARAVGKRALGNRLAEHMPSIGEAMARVDGKNTKVWTNVEIRGRGRGCYNAYDFH